ncbi:MAG TPA: ABC transporter permease [Thermoanaerobaculia bacterium]|nr:ABC transporter permease [Thermoanaerobaculia bacterium]
MPEPGAGLGREEKAEELRRVVRAELLRWRLPERRADDVIEEIAQLLLDAAEADGVALDSSERVRAWVRGEVPRWRELAAELGRAEHPLRTELLGDAGSRAARARRDRGRSRRDQGSATMMGWLDGFFGDARFAMRSLRKTPLFTVVAVTTLALGIGLNSAAFSVLDGIFFRPLPVESPDELVRLYGKTPDGFFGHEPLSYPDYEDVAREVEGFSTVAGYSMTMVALEAEATPEMVLAEMVTGTYFSALGVRARVGRLIEPADERRSSPAPVVVLSHRAWQRRYGGDPSAIGQEILINGQRATIIGVAPAAFRGLSRGIEPELWLGVTYANRIDAAPSTNSGDSTAGVDRLDDRGRRWLWVFARLDLSVPRAATDSQIAALMESLRERFPESHEDRDLVTLPLSAVKLLPGIDESLDLASLMLMGVVGMVLIVACSNLASLLMARAASRRRDVATRLSLGATRLHVVRQLLVESVILALAGGVLGLGLAALSNRALSSFEIPFTVPLEISLSLDARVVLFTFAVALATALFFGLAPAVDASRTRLADVLREESGPRGGSAWRRRFQSALVVVQVSVTLLLLVFAGLSLRSVLRAQHLDPGLDPDGLIGAILDPSLQGYDSAETAALFRRLREDLESLPGVVSVSLPSQLPLSLYINSDDMIADGRQDLPEAEWPFVDNAAADATYFETLRIPIVAGRAFREEETVDRRRVTVVNETLAERFWPGEDPIGKGLRRSGIEDPYEVVGVAANGKYRALGEQPRTFAWFPIGEGWNARSVVVRFERPEQASTRVVAGAIHAIDPHLAIANLATVEEIISPSLLPVRAGALVFGVFGVFGLLLAALGLYGVLAYMVSQRTHELGVRVAMGANRATILGMVARDGLKLVAAGAVIGLGLSLLTTRLLSAILFGVSPTDAATFGVVLAVLASAALLACYLPARRATRIDPIQALRVD